MASRAQVSPWSLLFDVDVDERVIRASTSAAAMPSEETPLLVDEDRDPEEQEQRGLFHRHGPLSALEKGSLGAALGFFLLAALGFGLFAGEAYKLDHRPPPAGKTTTRTVTSTARTTATAVPAPVPSQPPTKNAQVCLTATCVRIAADVLEGLDQTVDPCDDFYTFTNGGWLEKHPVPEDKGIYGIAQYIGDYNQRILHSILDAKPAKDLPEADQRNLHHLRSFYDSCLDEDALDRVGLQPLTDIITPMLKLWRPKRHHRSALPPWLPPIFPPTPPDRGDDGGDNDDKEAPRSTRMTETLLYLHSRSVPVFFVTFLEGDTKVDPNIRRVWLQQAELGLPDPDYYKDKETVEVYREVVRSSIASVYADVDATRKRPYDELADEVVDLEKRIAKIMLDVVDLDDPQLTYNPLNSSALTELYPDLHWKDYFSGFSPRPTFPDPVIVSTVHYFKKLGAILEAASEETLEAYFIWRTAQEYGRSLGPRETVRKEVTWLGNHLRGVDEGVRETRADVCLTTLIEQAGFLVGRYYVQRAFPDVAKRYAEEVIASVITAFKERLPELDWLDGETRQYAEEKASAIRQKIGYPTSPNTTDPAALARYYAVQEPFDRQDFFGNVLRGKMAEQRRKWNHVGAQRDRGEWEMTPDEVNAYFSPPEQTIAFPAGILQAPYFSSEWPEYMAFGSFGSIAGHELSHAFDNVGSQYDKDGKLDNWWTNETYKQFHDRQQCILDQYAEYYIEDARGRKYHVNSRFTIGEDVADAGGIAQSFRAWRDRFAADQAGDRYDNYLLPGLDYTREQLFFMAYARGWARNLKSAEAVRRIRIDPHSPTKFRVRGPLSNSKEFAEAFGCKAGSAMVRKDRCQVW